jgi:predicted CoA-substrate-specific enzyme activase
MHILGIDVGSVSVSLALVQDTGTVADTRYAFHHGDVRGTLDRLLQELPSASVRGVACTSTTPDVLNDVDSYDWKVAYVQAARRLHGRVGSLLLVGGERFGMVFFDQSGGYLRYRSNSSCAAGTGSFLDQQARRLNLGGSDALARTALENSGDVPAIASRCSVFAKTDLIHAQQEGFSIQEICDGLCLGLARNVVDTVLTNQVPNAPLVMAGGVSRNAAVVRHVERLVGMDVVVNNRSHCYGAIGAGLLWLAEHPQTVDGSQERTDLRHLVREEEGTRRYHYEPLSPELPGYPNFTRHMRYRFPALRLSAENPVEVDVYEPLPAGSERSVYLGIDIGSTSTKAVLLGNAREVVAGFYTRTAGRPVPAVQGIFQTIDALARESGIRFRVRRVGTTGSGRKFIGKIIGADTVVDEISAHARAAYELDPNIDTIIEIGGQDSKFTTMQDGMVTFSQMNTVCAAGTGSFLEEQAGKLGVPVNEYAERAFGVAAPLTSDRCTVFMERDINHFLNRSYSVDAILAAALHSVRENYLTKVATRGAIGSHVCFQGATAKNRALVAAFAQELGKPVSVSRYCHLTGALGVALFLQEQPAAGTRFRGLALYRDEIPVERETCGLCKNHCRIRVATVGGERVAFGFRCGRDDDASGYVSRNRSGFSLEREWREARRATASVSEGRVRTAPTEEALPTIGIPAALHLYEDLPLWRRFFAELGVPVVTSEAAKAAVKEGKLVSGAEFCAPMSALHGHVRYLQDRADYVFLPIYIERSGPDSRRGRSRQYCYYTQFASSVVSLSTDPGRCISPLVRGGDDDPRTQKDLCDALRPVLGDWLSQAAVADAYDRALRAASRASERLRWAYHRQAAADDVNVVLLGRPYTVLSPEMNSGIPDVFGALGVRAFFQDMVDYEPEDVASIDPLLDAFHWRYAAKILEVATVSTRTPGMYPVLITSFKCAPDSFLMEYFRRIMDARQALPHSATGRARFQRGLRDPGRSCRAGLPESSQTQHRCPQTAPTNCVTVQSHADAESGGQGGPVPELGYHGQSSGGGGPQTRGHSRTPPGGRRRAYSRKHGHQHRPVHSHQHHRARGRALHHSPWAGSGEHRRLDGPGEAGVRHHPLPVLHQDPVGGGGVAPGGGVPWRHHLRGHFAADYDEGILRLSLRWASAAPGLSRSALRTGAGAH